jgi:hypothetical protein
MPRQELHFSSAVAGTDALQWNAMATVLWEEEESQNPVSAGLLWCLQHGEHSFCVVLLHRHEVCFAVAVQSAARLYTHMNDPAAHNMTSWTRADYCLLQTTYYVALFMLPLGDAVTINLVGPPVTAIFARLLLKEPLG